MVSKAQIAFAKAGFEQMRTTSMYAFDAWGATLKSQGALAEGFRGTPLEAAVQGLLDAHTRAHAAAYEAMTKAGEQYMEALRVAEKNAF